MNVEELTRWVEEGYEHTAACYRPDDPRSFWPEAAIPGQGEAALWSLATTLRAAEARYRGHTMQLCAPWARGSDTRKMRELVARRWTDYRGRSHAPYEVMVDYTIHDWGERRPLLVCAESEMYAFHGTGGTMEGEDEYSWEFYKFLLTPGRLRLFFARVGPVRGVEGPTRRDQLEETLESLLRAYGPGLLGANDELGVVLLPEEREGEAWRDLRICAWDLEGLQRHRPWR